MKLLLLAITVCLVIFVTHVESHGHMVDPPNRASMWRYDPWKGKVAANYDDNQYFCGGFQKQWEVFKGKCGPCGDSFGDLPPRSNENTGKYGRGNVVKTYKSGQDITVTVLVTANHLGYFEFSICKLTDVNKPETEECFQYLLQQPNGAGTRYNITSATGQYTVRLKLPFGLTCPRCVLRWHYNTGNSWGTCPDGTGAIGCGAQETFRSCADIAII